MKHIVYLDERRLRSFYAQAFDGLEDFRTQSEQYELTDSETIHPNVKHKENEGQLSFVAVKGKTSESTTDAYKDESFANKEQTSESVRRALHDNALVRAIDYSERMGMLTSENDAVIGKYILVTGAANMLDFSYYPDSMDDKQIEYMANASVSQQIDALNINNEKAKSLERKKRIDAFINKTKTGLNAMNFMRKLFPFDALYLINKCFIPMNNKCFIENYGQRLLLYEGNITVFGRVTKKSAELFDNSTLGVYGVLNGSISRVIHDVLKGWGVEIGESVFISPIAAFYE